MRKISKIFKAFSILMSQPSLVNALIDSSWNRKNEFLKKYNLKHGLKAIHLTDLIDDSTIFIKDYSYQGGNSLPTDLALLQSLCKQTLNCNYFEIGTWRGESAMAVSAFCEECYSLNLSGEAMKSIGLEVDYINQHELFSKNNPKITHLKGDSMKFDFSPYYGKMDVVFIDGNHHYEFVLNDTREAYKLLKDENSVIVWHDYTKNGEEIRWDILKAILDGSIEENRALIYQVKDSLSAIYTKSKIQSFPNTFWQVPKYLFDIQLNVKPFK